MRLMFVEADKPISHNRWPHGGN
uniref:Uncharacterized protein n=1 Tax=Anguilla anguilla TaxID=7936 RepID=A0A0E9T391_ANGAN